MLVLGRKEGETIKIGDDIKITVVRLRPGEVRIGIEAPKALDIVRHDAKDKTEQGRSLV